MTYWPDPPDDGPDLDDDFFEWCEATGHDPDDDDAPQEYELALIDEAAQRRADAILDDRGR